MNWVKKKVKNKMKCRMRTINGWCREKFVTLTKQERWDYSKRDIISLRDEFRLDKSHNE